MSIHALTMAEFGDDVDVDYERNGICSVCGEPCGTYYTVCQSCAYRRRELRKRFRRIIAARRERYGGHISARELMRAWWSESMHDLAKGG